MYTTNNYSVLKSLDGGEDKKIYPNKPFGAFIGNYKALSTLQIYKDGEFSFEIAAGTDIKGIGEAEEIALKPKQKKKATPKKEEVVKKATSTENIIRPTLGRTHG